jgi:hemoglobin
VTAACRDDIGTRDDIGRLVQAFYRDAAMDDLLGPIFEAADVDWPEHIETLTEFWSWQLLGERGYDGNPLRAHEPIHARFPFRDAHFQRWLELFTATVDENFCGPIAATAKIRAVKMAHALQRLLGGAHGAPGESGRAFWTAKPAEVVAAVTALVPGVRLLT